MTPATNSGCPRPKVATFCRVTEPTIRKVEGGSNRHPARRLVNDMYRCFRQAGEAQGIPVVLPPYETSEPDQVDLAAAIVALTDELTAMRQERALWAAWARGVAAAFRAYEGGQVSADLLDALMPPLREEALP